jgi:hypothetical protein
MLFALKESLTGQKRALDITEMCPPCPAGRYSPQVLLIGAFILGETVSWSVAAGLVAVIIGVAALNGQLSPVVTARPTRR